MLNTAEEPLGYKVFIAGLDGGLRSPYVSQRWLPGPKAYQCDQASGSKEHSSYNPSFEKCHCGIYFYTNLAEAIEYQREWSNPILGLICPLVPPVLSARHSPHQGIRKSKSVLLVALYAYNYRNEVPTDLEHVAKQHSVPIISELAILEDIQKHPHLLDTYLMGLSIEAQ